MNHPGICTVHDVVEHNDDVFIVLPPTIGFR